MLIVWLFYFWYPKSENNISFVPAEIRMPLVNEAKLLEDNFCLLFLIFQWFSFWVLIKFSRKTATYVSVDNSISIVFKARFEVLDWNSYQLLDGPKLVWLVHKPGKIAWSMCQCPVVPWENCTILGSGWFLKPWSIYVWCFVVFWRTDNCRSTMKDLFFLAKVFYRKIIWLSKFCMWLKTSEMRLITQEIILLDMKCTIASQ